MMGKQSDMTESSDPIQQINGSILNELNSLDVTWAKGLYSNLA